MKSNVTMVTRYPFPVQGVPHWQVKSSGVRQSKISKCPGAHSAVKGLNDSHYKWLTSYLNYITITINSTYTGLCLGYSRNFYLIIHSLTYGSRFIRFSLCFLSLCRFAVIFLSIWWTTLVLTLKTCNDEFTPLSLHL